jgi:hypothetical protein
MDTGSNAYRHWSAAEQPASVPTTGTVDDEDEPEDEHEDENEATGREQRDDTELPEEFKRDDEDRADAGA